MTTFGKTSSSTLKLGPVIGPIPVFPERISYSTAAFIRGLLENVGVEISPIRLIRRIKNGLEIPGLKEALIKILQDFHLQISLLEGCQRIMDGDISDLSLRLQKNQTNGFFLTGNVRYTSLVTESA